jgi:hypothetical protein
MILLSLGDATGDAKIEEELRELKPRGTAKRGT